MLSLPEDHAMTYHFVFFVPFQFLHRTQLIYIVHHLSRGSLSISQATKCSRPREVRSKVHTYIHSAPFLYVKYGRKSTSDRLGYWLIEELLSLSTLIAPNQGINNCTVLCTDCLSTPLTIIIFDIGKSIGWDGLSIRM